MTSVSFLCKDEAGKVVKEVKTQPEAVEFVNEHGGVWEIKYTSVSSRDEAYAATYARSTQYGKFQR